MIHRVLRKPVLLNDKRYFEKASSFKKKKKKKRVPKGNSQANFETVQTAVACMHDVPALPVLTFASCYLHLLPIHFPHCFSAANFPPDLAMLENGLPLKIPARRHRGVMAESQIATGVPRRLQKELGWGSETGS